MSEVSPALHVGLGRDYGGMLRVCVDVTVPVGCCEGVEAKSFPPLTHISN